MEQKVAKQAQFLIYGMYAVIAISLISAYYLNKKVDRLVAAKKS